MTTPEKKSIVLAISGASGALYPKIFIDEVKKQPHIDLRVTASSNALRIFRDELNLDLRDYVEKIHSPKSFDVPYVSGSAKMDAMVILPCSTGMLGRIAHGVSDDGITRAADVFLKEKRQLILVPRETPLNTIHLQNMLTLAQAGATILPAMPSFYHNPQTLTEACETVVARILDHLKIENTLGSRWQQNHDK